MTHGLERVHTLATPHQVEAPKSDGELATTAPQCINLRLPLRDVPLHYPKLVNELLQQLTFTRRTDGLGPAAFRAERGVAHASHDRLPVAARTDARSVFGVGLEAQESTREHKQHELSAPIGRLGGRLKRSPQLALATVQDRPRAPPEAAVQHHRRPAQVVR